MEEKWICRHCGCPLKMELSVFEYLGFTASQEIPKCPQCGKSLVSAALVRDKIEDAEKMMEDK